MKMNCSFLSFALFCSITMFQSKTVDSVITGTLATPLRMLGLKQNVRCVMVSMLVLLLAIVIFMA